MVATHKQSKMPTDEELYLPVLVGATQNFRDGISYQRDDTGDNISEKNDCYSELTATYWAWKNIGKADAVGLVHYRRYFFKSGKRTLDNVIEKPEIEKLLSEYPVILPKKRRYYIESNYSHYIHAHHSEPLEVTRTVIKKYYPKYAVAFEDVMKKRSAHMFNMFIMRREYFDDYGSFLFGVLSHVEDIVDLKGYSVQEKRVFGYLSELLMDVWILGNDVSYKEVRWGQIGSRHIPSKLFFFAARKFGFGLRKTHFE